jgi:putative transposase
VKYDPDKHHRRSIRLKEYDYASRGAYFVTICVQNRECVLGDVMDGHMVLNDTGQIADQFWPAVADHFADIGIDVWVTMPNHVHAVIVIGRGAVSAPTVATPNDKEMGGEKGGETPPLQSPVLGPIVAYFKYQTTKSINQMRDAPGARFWQRNYWEHIIRNETELDTIRQYVETNPMRWTNDQLHPDAPPNKFNRG